MDYDEREMSLSSLFFYVLKQWRVIIIVMIIGALVGGIYKYISTIRNATTEENTKIEVDISDEPNYSEESILMKINPSGANVITASYKFTMDNAEELFRDPVDEVISSYQYYFCKDDDFKALADEYETDVKYIKELCDVKIDKDGNVITLASTGIDEKMAQSVMSVLKNELNTLPKSDCTITEITSEKSELFYGSFVDRKVYRKNNSGIISKEETKASTGLKTVLKWAIIGCLIGMIIAIIFYAIKYLVNQLLWNSDEFRDYYDYQILGTFSQKPEKNGIDKWIQNWQKRLTSQTDEQVVNEAMMIIHSKYVDVDSILLIGTVSKEKLAYVAEKIRLCMPEIKVTSVNSNDLHADNLKELIESDDVIIVEEREKSYVKNIDKEVLEIRQYDKRVLGCIVM